MRVAVVGANLLGCASAFYVRQALDANRADRRGPTDGGGEDNDNDETEPLTARSDDAATAAAETDPDSEDEIVIFEQLPRAGGHKFVTAAVDGQSAPVGTAATFDTSSSPPLRELLRAADIAPPDRAPAPDWAVLDWRGDEYVAWQTRSATLKRLMGSTVACVLLQTLGLCLAAHLFSRARALGLIGAFSVRRRRGAAAEFDYLALVELVGALALGCGLVPARRMLRLLDGMQRHALVRVLGVINFGAPPLAMLVLLADTLRGQLDEIVRNDSASSCVTLGHFLSSCGFARFAKTSAAEFFAEKDVPRRLLDAAVAPSLTAAVADSRVAPDERCNALVALLALLGSARMPAALRERAARFDAAQTDALCPGVARAARAALRLNVRVGGVRKRSTGRAYDVVDGDGGSLGEFDGVVLAAVVDPERFDTDATDGPLRDALGLGAGRGAENDNDDAQPVNTARVTTLVAGTLRPHFLRTDAGGVATETAVRRSAHVSAVARVCAGVYRVVGAQGVCAGGVAAQAVFARVGQTGVDRAGVGVRDERAGTRYGLGPLREPNGRSAPSFILARRLLFAAMADRVANDASVDVLAARNVGSFFRDGVVNWK